MTKDRNDKTRTRIINACTDDINAALSKCRESLVKECGMTVEQGMFAAFRNAVGFLKVFRRVWSDKVRL